MADTPIDALVELLLQVDSLLDPDERDRTAEATADALRRMFTVQRTPDAHNDLLSLIHSYEALSGGVVAFAGIVADRHPDNSAALRALELARSMRGGLLLSSSDRRDVVRLLSDAGTTQVFEALDEEAALAGVPELGNRSIWRDWPAVVRVMERQPTPEDAVPPLIGFVMRLARLLDSNTGSALRRWAANVAGGLGVPKARLDALRLGGLGEERAASRRRPGGGRAIRGGVPLQNHNFTGRVSLLNRLGETLASGTKAAVLPHAVHGMGGVGKTQLVLEYVYQHLEDYDLVWWVPADAASGVLTSLEQLAGQLGVRPGENANQTARLVLDALAVGPLKWLLVYDNANDLDSIDEYVPSTGGDVIVTTRNREWAAVGLSIEVDVFDRHESIDMLRKRTGNSISTADADRLADRLGDLPLALEQAAAWHLLTRMPVAQYIDLLEKHQKELLSEGKPAGYPTSVVAFVTLAIERLRAGTPATAQLLELFAYLGGEPVPVSLLRYGRDADVVQPLRALLGDPIKINLAVRDLNQYGLVKVDNAQRLQVHRLVQGVLREALDDLRAEDTLRSVQSLLAKANAGDPDEKSERTDLDRQREIGPHLRPADMIGAKRIEARQAVLDHARYLYNMGDYENSRRLSEDAAEHWARPGEEPPKLGPDGELTLQAQAHIGNAMRALGDSAPADELTNDTYERMRLNLGDGAKSTLTLSNQIGQAMRIRGEYAQSLAFTQESLERHQQALEAKVFERAEPYVLRAQSNLAVAYRMIGDFGEAAKLDQATLDFWEGVNPLETNFGALEAYMNIARDYYGLGAYQAGLAVLEGWRGALTDQRSTGHRLVLLSGRTYGVTLRKAGRLREAADVLAENLDQTLNRFGPNHEYTVAVLCSYGNALRQLGDAAGAVEHIAEAVRRYRTYFGAIHPLTLVTLVNEAAARRAAGDREAAAELDADAYGGLISVLGADHPYTLCAGTSLATDHALRGAHAEARALSEEMLERSRRVSGGSHEVRDNTEHPYLLARAVNLALDLRATGAADEAESLRQSALAALRQALGANHPEVADAERGERLEGDIEAPPT